MKKNTIRNDREEPAVQRNSPATISCLSSIVRRKYLTDLRTEIADELSVRIECDGQHAFFPLSENEHAAAEEKAETIRSVVARSGWSAGARFVRTAV